MQRPAAISRAEQEEQQQQRRSGQGGETIPGVAAGFRRAGMAHPDTATVYPKDYFSEAELAAATGGTDAGGERGARRAAEESG